MTEKEHLLYKIIYDMDYYIGIAKKYKDNGDVAAFEKMKEIVLNNFNEETK